MKSYPSWNYPGGVVPGHVLSHFALEISKGMKSYIITSTTNKSKQHNSSQLHHSHRSKLVFKRLAIVNSCLLWREGRKQLWHNFFNMVSQQKSLFRCYLVQCEGCITFPRRPCQHTSRVHSRGWRCAKANTNKMATRIVFLGVFMWLPSRMPKILRHPSPLQGLVGYWWSMSFPKKEHWYWMVLNLGLCISHVFTSFTTKGFDSLPDHSLSWQICWIRTGLLCEVPMPSFGYPATPVGHTDPDFGFSSTWLQTLWVQQKRRLCAKGLAIASCYTWASLDQTSLSLESEGHRAHTVLIQHVLSSSGLFQNGGFPPEQAPVDQQSHMWKDQKDQQWNLCWPEASEQWNLCWPKASELLDGLSFFEDAATHSSVYSCVLSFQISLQIAGPFLWNAPWHLQILWKLGLSALYDRRFQRRELPKPGQKSIARHHWSPSATCHLPSLWFPKGLLWSSSPNIGEFHNCSVCFCCLRPKVSAPKLALQASFRTSRGQQRCLSWAHLGLCWAIWDSYPKCVPLKEKYAACER